VTSPARLRAWHGSRGFRTGLATKPFQLCTERRHECVGRCFERVVGTVTIAKDLTASSLEVTVETASIGALFGARDQDLRSTLSRLSPPQSDLSPKNERQILPLILTERPDLLAVRFVPMIDHAHLWPCRRAR
jgi:hypothetical protein